MTSRQVRFASPAYSDAADTTSGNLDVESNSSTPGDRPITTQCALEEDPINWWGAFVPLESWTPPNTAMVPRFRAYNFAAELPHGYVRGDDASARRERRYDLCFNGDSDEVIMMLAGEKFQMDSLSRLMIGEDIRPGFRTRQIMETPEDNNTVHQGTTEDTAGSWALQHTGGEPTGTANVAHDSYGSGLHGAVIDTSALASVMAREVDDPYDCGWEDDSITGALSIIEDPYDCGWEEERDEEWILPDPPHANGPADIPDINTLLQEGNADPYDCGWEDTQDDKAFLSEGLEDLYDCGWEDVQDNKTFFSEGPDDPYDCGWECLSHTDAPAYDVHELACQDRVDVKRLESDHMTMTADGMEQMRCMANRSTRQCRM
ncbi:uncharacterized protein HD556DRAFT_1310046 [Suillus plorans]|uniref:Uncharacterized protein n=1 Tax=Suillus plorans TaxID=116603 RepID=A0A9P7AKH9_9AGAM|nr:uncharacterized protein HD556DRAFT_1310046 [Suillus plorans]KAG1791161.1 hypothetical protein HD556DRAFT_1310046 [Suillus plorans]